jgi:hypothetical protein
MTVQAGDEGVLAGEEQHGEAGDQRVSTEAGQGRVALLHRHPGSGQREQSSGKADHGRWEDDQ